MPDIFAKESVPSYKRIDAHMLDPREITIRPEFNGRQELPPIDDLLEDFPNSRIGQLKPVLITKRDGVPVLLDGHRRWRAAIELTKRKAGPFEGVFKLKCSYFVGTDAECFVATVKANSHAPSSPADDGYNISKLLHNFNMSEEDVAVKVYGRTNLDGSPDVTWVRERAAIADLSEESLAAMKDGKIKPNAAVELAKLSKAAQKSVLKSVGSGKVTVGAVKRAATPVPQSGAKETPPMPPAKRKFQKQDFCDILSRYLASDLPPHILDMTVENAVRTVLGEISDEIECGQ